MSNEFQADDFSDDVKRNIITEIARILKVNPFEQGKTSDAIYVSLQGDYMFRIIFVGNEHIILSKHLAKNPHQPYWLLTGIFSEYFEEAILCAQLI